MYVWLLHRRLSMFCMRGAVMLNNVNHAGVSAAAWISF